MAMTQQILPVILVLLLCGCETDTNLTENTSPFKSANGDEAVKLSTLDIQLKKFIVLEILFEYWLLVNWNILVGKISKLKSEVIE